MTRVQLRVKLTEETTLDTTRDEDYFSAIVGVWMVEAFGGYLVVRKPNRPANELPLLRVPCDEVAA